MEEVAKRVEVDGIQAWWDLDSRDILGADADNYEKVPDTLDVWFDSAPAGGLSRPDVPA
jgi:isoleucyl-tRNA synthetase